MKPKISIIAAIGEENRALGKNNKLLWYIPEDLKRFKELTKGHVVIMGRKTYESIGKLLPERLNIIVTRDSQSYIASNPELVSGSDYKKRSRNKFGMTTIGVVSNSLDEALKIVETRNDREVFIIGGGQIYEQAMPLADRLYLTLVEGEFEADTFFPDYSEFKKVVSQEKGESGKYRYTFFILEKAGTTI